MDPIEKICKAVLKLTDGEFADAYSQVKDQRNFIHPLKMATSRSIQKTGENNYKILKAIQELKRIIENGKGRKEKC